MAFYGTTIQESLPSLVFHHNNGSNDSKIKWQILRNLSFDDIIKTLVDENCICLCGNCHKMIHTLNFEKNAQKIVKKEYLSEIKTFYTILRKYIYDFKFKKLNITDPFK